ncbi:hypothetical protein V6O07_23475, partial [Arthrospira platensis SPKY2]
PEAGLMSTLSTISEAIQSEAGYDSVSNIKEIMLNPSLSESYNDFLLGDYHTYEGQDQFAAQLHEMNVAKLETKFENSAKELLDEAGASALNPVVGLTFPLLKLNWIENVFKDYFHTEIATTPVINRQIERVFLLDGKGKKYYIPDVYNEGDQDTMKEVTTCADRKLVAEEIPIQIGYNLMEKSGGSVRQRDEISRNFRIVEVRFNDGSKDATVKVNIKPNVVNDTFSEIIKCTIDSTEHVDMLSGTLNFQTGILNLGSASGKIKGVKVAGTLSSENNMSSASVGWETENKQFVIETKPHLNTGLTKERLKDESIIYNIDAQAKAISNMSMVLNQLKDFEQKTYLDESREMIKDNPKLFVQTTFDCSQTGQYALTEVEYRSIMLKEQLDKLAERLKRVLREPNCFFAVVGHPEDIRLLQDISWQMQEGTSVVGGCRLEYSFGLMNANHRFLILSSAKCAKGELRVIIRPMTETQISYIHLDYSFIISNEYRDPNMPNVPSVMATQRYTTDEVIPVQGVVKILNNNL